MISYNESKKKKTLKIDKTLPQIIVPANKLQMFQDWWNSDIRFEKSIPHSFNSGYMKIANIVAGVDVDNLPDYYRELIKNIAHTLHMTYRSVETQMKEFLSSSKQLTIYFTFTDENSMYAETYDNTNELLSTMTFSVGEGSSEEDEIHFDSTDELENFDDVMNKMNKGNLVILITCLWYIATTSKNTKYIYETKTPVVTSRHKNIVNVSDTKTINTPIYDMNKIRVVKVESLQARKKGWTYSHSFQVHGHYRHYANGKTIFIQPFIKGKIKSLKLNK